MKKYLIVFIFFVVTIVGCGQTNLTTDQGSQPEQEPFYEGTIINATENTVLVSGTSNKYDSNQFTFHIGVNTIIVSGADDQLSSNDIQEGDEVKVWIDPNAPIMESYPPQVEASKIILNP